MTAITQKEWKRRSRIGGWGEGGAEKREGMRVWLGERGGEEDEGKRRMRIGRRRKEGYDRRKSRRREEEI